MEIEKTITEHVQFLNQINLSEIRYAYLNHKGKIICYRGRGHGVLELNIELKVLHITTCTILCKRKKRNKVCR